jgi:hypothetical protein
MKRGYAKKIKKGLLTSPAALLMMSSRFDRKAEKVMPEKFKSVIVAAPEKWEESMRAILGVNVNPELKENLRKGLDEGKEIYPVAVKGKGVKMAKYYYEKLVEKLAQ